MYLFLLSVVECFVSALVMVSLPVMKHWYPKQSGEERPWFSLQLSSHTSSVREARAGTWR